MKKIISIIIASSIIAGCNDHPQPQRVEQVYIQPPVQTFVVDHQSNGVASFATGAAVGALAGHLLTKESNNIVQAEPVKSSESKINHMDTSKIGNVEPITKPVTKTTGMDMNIMAQSSSSLNNSSPVKPVSKMNMTKLGKH